MNGVLFTINFRRETFELLISHDHKLVLVDLVTTHGVVRIEILASFLGEVFSREWLAIWSKHAQ